MQLKVCHTFIMHTEEEEQNIVSSVDGRRYTLRNITKRI